ncbi:MAG: succinylglutamate desuccinylase/aspartoacylase family protein [Eubacteriales bacterium]|nr:succinylglutamate desuccinylase/aspartoacylase family protein [Eubacteriales bacterium]
MGIRKQITTVKSIAMPIGENWTVSRCRYEPEEGTGKRLCIASGVHGDELMGQMIVYGVARGIMEEPQNLCGTVDLYPMLNPLGMDIGERMVPASTRLDMNRAFPGAANGTPMESMCHHIVEDMRGADLVLDVHSSAKDKSELYEVRINARCAGKLVPTSALCMTGTPAMVLVANERIRHPREGARIVIEGIFCKMKEMGIWKGEAKAVPLEDAPLIRTQQDVCRVTCTKPGMFVPDYCLGKSLEKGERLGVIIDALRGEPVEEVLAPASGLVFSQRGYSAVYPGTLIARQCRKE